MEGVKCPDCQKLISEKNITLEIYIDRDDEVCECIEVNANCDSCNKEFFYRFEASELIEAE